MPSTRQLLTNTFAQAFQEQGFSQESAARWGEVSVSDRPDLAQFQCNGALGAAKSEKKNPRELAQKIVASLQANTSLAVRFQLSIAGPGFINIVLNDAYVSEVMNGLRADSRLGVDRIAHPRTVVIDFGGPNVAKAMHVGHLRSTIIGDSLCRIFRFVGDRVIGDNHLGDWGTPMGMVICELKREKPELPYFKSEPQPEFPKESPVTMEDLERLYPEGSKRFKEDPQFKSEVLRATDELQKGSRNYRALWQHFVDTTFRELNRDYASLGVKFDVWLGESFYEEKMPPMVKRLQDQGQAVMSEGAWVIPLISEQDPEIPPLILVKSGGGYLYHTSDLATVEYRVNELKADLALYAIDNRQALHLKQIFLAARKVGIAKGCELVHTGFGTMNGKDGKPFKTRDGGILKLKDVIAMVNEEARKRLSELGVDQKFPAEELDGIANKVGTATLKYADLKNNRTVDYVFDLERFAQFEGNTGPYLLYAAVRIKSILRKAREQGFEPGAVIEPNAAIAEQGNAERLLMLEMLKLPDVLARAYDAYEPHHLCDYGFNLSQVFNQFYQSCHILREENAERRASWLALCQLVHDQLILVLDLLGIQVPERM